MLSSRGQLSRCAPWDWGRPYAGQGTIDDAVAAGSRHGIGAGACGTFFWPGTAVWPIHSKGRRETLGEQNLVRLDRQQLMTVAGEGADEWPATERN